MEEFSDSSPNDTTFLPTDLTSIAEIADAWRREAPGVAVDSIAVITSVWRTAKLLAGDRMRTLSRLGMDAATLDLLSTLRRAGHPYRLSTRELTQRCLVSAGAISQRVAKAESLGLVVRSKPAEGGKTVLVTLTDEGSNALLPVVAGLLEHEAGHIAPLTADEQDQLVTLLAKLAVPLIPTHEPAAD